MIAVNYFNLEFADKFSLPERKSNANKVDAPDVTETFDHMFGIVKHDHLWDDVEENTDGEHYLVPGRQTGYEEWHQSLNNCKRAETVDPRTLCSAFCRNFRKGHCAS